MRNYGGLEPRGPSPYDMVAGNISPVDRFQPKLEDGNWEAYLPAKEVQYNNKTDYLACVTFSANNCIETMLKQMGIDINISDRYTAKISGTTNKGNYGHKVANSLKFEGFVLETDYPTAPNLTFDEYYRDIIEMKLRDIAMGYSAKYDIDWRWVDISDVNKRKELLKVGPIQIFGSYASHRDAVDGIIPNKESNNTYGHAWVMYNSTNTYEDTYDSYDVAKKKLAKDYLLNKWGIQFDIIIKDDKPMDKVNIKDNYLVGAKFNDGFKYGLALGGKIFTYKNEGELLIQWNLRNNGNVAGKTITISGDEWGRQTIVD